MSEGSGQQRYCRNCGAEIRSGMSFCVSCGAPVTPVAAGAGPTNPGPTPSNEPSPFDNLMAWLRQAAGSLRGSFSGLSTDDARRLPGRAVEWFRDLSGVPKLVLVGLAVLALLIILSPVAAIVAALLFGVSIIALIIRVVQKGSIKNWGIVGVASVVLMFTFGGISDALYGIGFGGGSDVDYEVVSEDVGTDGDSQVYHVVSSSNDLKSLNLVAQEIQQERLQQSSGMIAFYKSRADVPNGDPVGVASIFSDEMQVRALYDGLWSSEEVEQIVDLFADNGYVLTSVLPSHKSIPAMPDFMYEVPNPTSATATSTASANPKKADPYAISPTTQAVPYYEVEDAAPTWGTRGLELKIAADINMDSYREDLDQIFEDIAKQASGRSDFVHVVVTNHNGVPLGGGSVAPGQMMVATGYISLTDFGATLTEVPAGSYRIEYQ